jgi:hypothetical protein
MPALPTMLDCWAADPLAARLIHLDLLRALVANWPALDGSGVTSESFDWGGTRARKHFQGALGRGLMAGGFIDWFRRDYQ